jgi:hypothetical protein
MVPQQKNDTTEPKREAVGQDQSPATEVSTKPQVRLTIKSGLKAGLASRCHHHTAPE